MVAFTPLRVILRLSSPDRMTFAALLAERVIARDSLSAKVILSGELKRKVTLKGLKATKGARAAIEAAGGKYEEPAPKPAPEKKLVAKEKKAKE